MAVMTYSYDSFGKYYMQEASRHYFCDELPDGCDTWGKEELDDWCEDNA